MHRDSIEERVDGVIDLTESAHLSDGAVLRRTKNLQHVVANEASVALKRRGLSDEFLPTLTRGGWSSQPPAKDQARGGCRSR